MGGRDYKYRGKNQGFVALRCEHNACAWYNLNINTENTFLSLNQYYLQSSTVFADGNTVTYHSISGFKVNIDQSVCYRRRIRIGTLDF